MPELVTLQLINLNRKRTLTCRRLGCRALQWLEIYFFFILIVEAFRGAMPHTLLLQQLNIANENTTDNLQRHTLSILFISGVQFTIF